MLYCGDYVSRKHTAPSYLVGFYSFTLTIRGIKRQSLQLTSVYLKYGLDETCSFTCINSTLDTSFQPHNHFSHPHGYFHSPCISFIIHSNNMSCINDFLFFSCLFLLVLDLLCHLFHSTNHITPLFRCSCHSNQQSDQCSHGVLQSQMQLCHKFGC